MLKSQSNYLYNKRQELLKLAKTSIAKYGLTSNTLKDVSKKNGFDINETDLLFPEGKNDLINFALKELNKNLEEHCKKIDLIRLPVHKRIRNILLSKIDLMNKEKKFYKVVFLNILIPKRNFSLPKQLYDSIDQIWFIAGDTSTDFNYYSKRLILAGIYSRIILHFFNNDNQKELESLLDENLRRVSKIPEVKSKLNIIKEYFPKLLNIVKNST